MKYAKFSALLLTLAAAGATACSTGDGSAIPHFVNPFRLLITSKDVTFDGGTKRLAFVSNNNGTVSILDIRDRRPLDSDEFDDEETPLTIGGDVTEIFEWRPSGLAAPTVFKLLVIDKLNNRLFVFDANADTVAGTKTIVFKSRKVGATEIVAASRPVYFNQGRPSNPSISDIAVDPQKTINENWRMTTNGNNVWRVEGSVSGIQKKEAVSGKAYVSDKGEIGFTILEGTQLADEDDAFFFGTIKATPLELQGTPDAAALVDDKLYIANRDNQQIDVLDLPSMTFGTAIALNDGTGEQVLISDMQLSGTKLAIANRGAGQSFFVVNTANDTIQSFNLTFATSRLLLRNNQAFLMPINETQVRLFKMDTNAMSSNSIQMSNIPTVGALLKGDEGVSGNALIVNQNNAVDLVNLDTFKRVDTRDNGDTESFANQALFFDYGAKSDPSIADVITQDGVTKTENWVLIYEGIVEGTPSQVGDLAGTTLTDTGKDFQALPVIVGDLVVINPANPATKEEFKIVSIDDATHLTLSGTPDQQGTNVKYEIRADNSYTMKGTLSGFQTKRPKEGTVTKSDGNEITFSISPSALTSPTTRGDYFSFDSDDGITPIATTGDLGIDIKVFEEDAYLLNTNSGDITVINIPGLEQENTID